MAIVDGYVEEFQIPVGRSQPNTVGSSDALKFQGGSLLVNGSAVITALTMAAIEAAIDAAATAVNPFTINGPMEIAGGVAAGASYDGLHILAPTSGAATNVSGLRVEKQSGGAVDSSDIWAGPPLSALDVIIAASWAGFLSGTVLTSSSPSYAGVTVLAQGVGTVAGLASNAYVLAASGRAYGAEFIAYSLVGGGGAVNTLVGLDAATQNIGNAVVASTYAAILYDSFNGGGGSITKNVGLGIASQTAGITNLAIETSLGLHDFGDLAQVPGTTGKTWKSVAGTTAPGTNPVFAGTVYYGGTGKLLGDPVAWELRNVAGVEYKCPLY